MAELLAPAGNFDSLYSAVYNGADAVYLGLDVFNARIKADNFNQENICDVTRFCHIHGVKVYVAFNVSIKEDEFDALKECIIACREAAVDAFIVTDIGAIDHFDAYAPDIPLHASTQMAIHNAEGAIVAKKLGFSRIVVARETVLCDIKKIKEETGLEIEYFAHGALCVAFSGNCLLSGMIGGNSGNRGRCLQPCRLKYTSSLNGKSSHWLSPSDQCLIEKLETLNNAGVDSYKIEGRLKSANYVGSVVKCYRYAIDNDGKIDKVLYENMVKTFNRGDFTKGYNFDSTKEIMSHKVQGNIGLRIGKITKSVKNGFYIKTDVKLSDKMGVKILDGDGYEIGGLGITDPQKTSDGYFIKSVNTFYPDNSEVRLTLDESSESYVKKKIPIKITVNQDKNVLTVKFTDMRNGSSSEISETFDYAESRPTSNDELADQIGKLGDTEFFVSDIDISYEGNLFMRKAIINDMRRTAVKRLEENVLFDYITSRENAVRESGRAVMIENRNRLKYSLCVEIENEYAITSYIANNANIVVNMPEFCIDTLQSIIKCVLKYNTSPEIVLKLPNVARGKDIDNIYKIIEGSKEISGIYADNLYAIEIANRFDLKVVGGSLLNIYNSKTVKRLELENYMISAELNLGECKEFSSDAFVFSYGYMPLMTLTHCPLQLAGKSACGCGCRYSGPFSYSDERHAFAIRRIKNVNCIFTLMNSVIHDIRAKINSVRFNKFVSFVNVDADYDGVARSFAENKTVAPNGNFTYGHLMRGVK